MEPQMESASSVSSLQGQQLGFSKEDWAKKYWFNTLQMVTVVNPLHEDWPFMVENRHFFIRAGASERFPGVIANVYLDGMSKILAQNEDNLGFMADPALKKIYYDKLIVSVEGLIQEHDNTPAYMRHVSPTAIPERAPWEENMEQATVVAPQAPVPPTPPADNDHVAPGAEKFPEPAKEGKPVTKEFELEGVKYKMVVSKDGKEMYYKAGKMTSAAEYFKAASM